MKKVIKKAAQANNLVITYRCTEDNKFLTETLERGMFGIKFLIKLVRNIEKKKKFRMFDSLSVNGINIKTRKDLIPFIESRHG